MEEKKSESICELADKIGEKYKDIKDVVLAIQKVILDNAGSLPEKYKPKSIMESRFIPAEEAYKKGMTSCGAMVNISSEMLRHLGYKVKLIHGESKDSVDHAWISVFDSESDSWIEYDLTKKDAVVLTTNTKKMETDSWEEIRDQIMRDHETLEERRRKRGLKD